MDHRFLFAHDYALINPLQVEASAWEFFPTSSLVIAELSQQVPTLPRLLNLRGLPDAKATALFAEVLQWEKGNPDLPFFTALLASDLPEEALRIRLGKRLLYRRPPNEPVMLRWYDPRVFRHLVWLLDESQIAQLLGPVHTLSWRDAVGRWHQCLRPAITGVLAPPAFRSAQWETLGRLGVLNRILAQLASEHPTAEFDAEQTDKLLAQAYETWGMEDEADCFLFAKQALCIHPQIHKSQSLRERLQQVQKGECSYVGACVDLDLTDLRNEVSESSELP